MSYIGGLKNNELLNVLYPTEPAGKTLPAESKTFHSMLIVPFVFRVIN